MANLSIGSGGGTQTSTQSPQALVGSGSSTEAASNVQPGGSNLQPTTAASPTGIALHPTQLPTINVNNIPKPVTSSSTTAIVHSQPKHHVNSGLLSVAAGLFIVAVIIFWMITRSAKNTTNYK
jgi:hypothetical protein